MANNPIPDVNISYYKFVYTSVAVNEAQIRPMIIRFSPTLKSMVASYGKNYFFSIVFDFDHFSDGPIGDAGLLIFDTSRLLHKTIALRKGKRGKMS